MNLLASCGAENREGRTFLRLLRRGAGRSPVRRRAKCAQGRDGCSSATFPYRRRSLWRADRSREPAGRVMAALLRDGGSAIRRAGMAGTGWRSFIGDAVMARSSAVPTVATRTTPCAQVRAADELRGGLDEAERRSSKSGYGTRLELRHGPQTPARGPSTGTERRRPRDRRRGQRRRAFSKQAAKPGEILLGEETYRLVRDGVEAETPQARSRRKVKSEPLAAYSPRLRPGRGRGGRRHEGSHGRTRSGQRELLKGARSPNVLNDPLVPTCFTIPRRRRGGGQVRRLAQEFLAGPRRGRVVSGPVSLLRRGVSATGR